MYINKIQTEKVYKDLKDGTVEVRISSGDTHPNLGVAPYLYVICHSHTKQVKRFVGWTKGDFGVNWRDEEF